MKRYVMILIFCLITPLFAGGLPDYVAKFDPQLAISLYREKINTEGEDVQIYYALARLYDRSGQIGLAEDCYRHLMYLEADKIQVQREYLGFLYAHRFYGRVRDMIRDGKIDTDWSRVLLAESYFHDALFDSALFIAAGLPEAQGGRLMRLSLEGINAAQRSPVLGGVMSAVIPGSGKIYAGRWMDGVQAFSMITAPAYNAWYHFAKNGTKSVRAWIWTGVTAWFYLSDIYGSVKAVKEYNT
ncbi:MAG: hypothetical protein K0B52_06235, partial [FCB group bacterium]|nr:hypothetical protein [FCB group bacterium]